MKIRYQINFRLNILSILLFGLMSLITYSQEEGSCAEKLANAQSLFDRGQVEQVPAMLRECLKTGFNREESLAAYKLLIQVYLFNDKLEIADSTMLDFLRKNPEYELSPTDHSSFVHLYNNFRVNPIVQISLHLGTNLPFLTFINNESISGEPGESSYSSKAINLFASLEAKFELSKNMEINIEPGYSQLSFTYIEEFLDYSITDYTETQRRIEIPWSVTYNIKSFNKLTLYGRLGFGPAITLGSSALAISSGTDLNNPITITGPAIDRKNSRISMDLFIQAGGGIKYKTRGGYFLAELRSDFGIFNQTINRDFYGELAARYNYVDDDFNLNSLNFTIGYTYIFYKPSKREE